MTLGFGCEFEQMLNGGQQRGALLLRPGQPFRKQCSKRQFYKLYACLQGILFCGALEAAEKIPRDIGLEVGNCEQVAIVVIQDNAMRGIVARGDAKQGIRECGAERSTGSDKAVMAVAPDRHEPRDASSNATKQPKVSSRERDSDDAHPALKAIVIGLWVGTILSWILGSSSASGIGEVLTQCRAHGVSVPFRAAPYYFVGKLANIHDEQQLITYAPDEPHRSQNHEKQQHGLSISAPHQNNRKHETPASANLTEPKPAPVPCRNTFNPLS